MARSLCLLVGSYDTLWPMNKTRFTCHVCKKEKAKEEMRRSERNRTIAHCKDCIGYYRCIHCKEKRLAKHFKTSSKVSRYVFTDGEKIRTRVCYKCDFKLNKDRYDRYDRQIQTQETLKAIVQLNIQRWRSKTRAMGNIFDLNYQYLQSLWDHQCGCCIYTNEPIAVTRGRSQWQSASLDRLNPLIGYVKGNVAWTTRLTNTTKGQRTYDEFLQFCQIVVIHCQDINQKAKQ